MRPDFKKVELKESAKSMFTWLGESDLYIVKENSGYYDVVSVPKDILKPATMAGVNINDVIFVDEEQKLMYVRQEDSTEVLFLREKVTDVLNTFLKKV
jgi:hypothetical protein